jgi:hypothetical protein
MNIQKRTPYFLILSLLAAGCLLISPNASAGETSSGSSEEVTQLLSQIKTEAIALRDDTDVLASWTRSKQVSWESHAGKLDEIKEHVNQAGELLDKLNKARDGGASQWQHQAIDRVYPLLKELADNTEATMSHFKDNKSTIHLSAYGDYAKAGYTLAKELTTLISDYVDFGDHEAEFHRLQDKLQPNEG